MMAPVLLLAGFGAAGAVPAEALVEGASAPVTSSPPATPLSEPGDVAQLMKALRSREPGVADAARTQLAGIATRAQKSGDPAERRRVADALVPVLRREALAPDKTVRWAAFDALTRLGCVPNTIFPPSPLSRAMR